MAIRVLARHHLRLRSTFKHTSDFPLLKPLSTSAESKSKYPTPLSQKPSTNAQLIPLTNLFQRYNFPLPQLNNFLNKNQFFLLKFNLIELEKSLHILSSFKIPEDRLVSVVYSCPGVLEYEFMRKWQVGFVKLGVCNACPAAIQSILEFSRRFGINPDRFCCKVDILKGLGFSDDTLCKIFEEFPGVVMMNRDELVQKIDFLLEVGIRSSEIDHVINLCPGILGSSIRDKLMLLLNEFWNLRFELNVVRREIVREPRILCMELGEMSRCLELLGSLKCRVPIKDKIFSKGMLRAGFDVKLRIDCLCKYGLIRREAFKVLWSEPRSITYKIGDLEKKLDFLLNEMRYDISCLVEVPEYLGVNFEKQIVPRYSVLEYLRSKGGLGCQVGLRDLINHSRLKFYNLYVKPYPECERLYARYSDIEGRNRHTVGLWKLFKPPSYPESKEDLENIKSFMESLA